MHMFWADSSSRELHLQRVRIRARRNRYVQALGGGGQGGASAGGRYVAFDEKSLRTYSPALPPIAHSALRAAAAAALHIVMALLEKFAHTEPGLISYRTQRFACCCCFAQCYGIAGTICGNLARATLVSHTLSLAIQDSFLACANLYVAIFFFLL